MAEPVFVHGNGWISDDSDFYGDQEMRDRLERKANRGLKRQAETPFSNVMAKRVKVDAAVTVLPTPSPTPRMSSQRAVNALACLRSRDQIAAGRVSHVHDAGAVAKPRNEVSDRQASDPVKVGDIFLGRADAWQRKESITDFLRRAPVAEPTTAYLGPWLWVGSPKQPYQHVKYRVEEDLPAFKKHANELLASFNDTKSKIETANSSKAAGTITRYMRPYREKLEEDLLMLAIKTGVTHGKWLLFPSTDNVPRTWRLIAEAASQGRLGPQAKVATYEPGNQFPVICVYTYSFVDEVDVRRVLDGLVELELVARDGGKTLYYKCDAYTHLGLNSGNGYKIKPTLYDSATMLKGEMKAKAEGPLARLEKQHGPLEALRPL
ncbi:hypothetical protein LTR53_015903 [Teratosphaeriaceae sp. CCFEE 6253]|nr:hypothetical protein LTR53_015903 [Teratosphaeriaceae sp. CCFEE 6253]